MRLKILPAALRKKKRYIAFQVISEQPIMYTDLHSAIFSALHQLYGDLGLSKISPKLIKDTWNKKTQVGIIRCNHLYVPQTITALGSIARLGDSRVTVKILKVSGTIKKIKTSIANKL